MNSDILVDGSLTIFLSFLSLILVLLCVAMYFWYRRNLKTVDDLARQFGATTSEIEILEAKLETLRDQETRYLEMEPNIKARREEMESISLELEKVQLQLAGDRKELIDLNTEAAKIRHAVDLLTEEKESLTEQRNELQETVEFLKGEIEDLGGEDSQGAAYERLKEEVAAKRTELSILKSDIRDKQRELDEAIDEINKMNEVVSQKDTIYEELQEKQEVLGDLESDIEQKRQIKRNLINDIDDLQLRKDRLGVSQTGDLDDVDEALDDLFIQPDCLSEEYDKKEDEEELAALDRVQSYLNSSNLFFSDRVIKAFHTSLKISDISPLTVLAGISGTGKTLLPIYYADALGIYSLIISVQPRWDSPQDMFGFYNYMESKYKATDLARSLIRMDPYNFSERDFSKIRGEKRSDWMFMVILDEMNLARIEYYFSEFLSKLEIRRIIDDPDDAVERERAEIELEVGPNRDDYNKFRLWIDHNVLFAGTMNEDETTFSLSDKVLDRANVLRFGRPPIVDETENDSSEEDEYLPNGNITLKQWNSWKKPVDDNTSWYRDVSKKLEIVNNSLEAIGRPFGHRIRKAIQTYIANYPGIDQEDAFKMALADQIEMKILPKFRGIAIKDKNSIEALDDLFQVITDLEDIELSEAFDKCRYGSSSGLFMWGGVTRKINNAS